MLPALMLVASSMTPFAPIEAFAQQEGGPDIVNVLERLSANSETQRETDSGDMPMIMSQDMELNMEMDMDFVTDEKDCQDANDNTNQQISQSDDQYGETSGPYPVIGSSAQAGANVVANTNVVLTDACGPIADQTTVGISQGSNQQGEGDQQWYSNQYVRNDVYQNDYYYGPVFE